MLQPVEKAPLRVDNQPQVGPSLLSVDYQPSGGVAVPPPVHAPSLHTPRAAAPPPVPEPSSLWIYTIAVHDTLRRVETELIGLRADLASRTWSARWARLLKGLRTWWDRLAS